MKTKKSLDAIEVDDIQPRPGVPAQFVKSEPESGASVFDVNTVIIYFDNRPTDVKITNASKQIEAAIVRGNTVEVSINQPALGHHVEFTVAWADGERSLVFTTKDTSPEVWDVWPANGSSIIGFKTIRLFLIGIPKNAKYYNHASESFGEVRMISNTLEFDVPHFINRPSISFTVSWTGKNGSVQKSMKLTYTNEDMKPEE